MGGCARWWFFRGALANKALAEIESSGCTENEGPVHLSRTRRLCHLNRSENRSGFKAALCSVSGEIWVIRCRNRDTLGHSPTFDEAIADLCGSFRWFLADRSSDLVASFYFWLNLLFLAGHVAAVLAARNLRRHLDGFHPLLSAPVANSIALSGQSGLVVGYEYGG